LYVATTRFQRENFSTLFDAANPEQPVDKRNRSTVGPQALFFLNSPFIQQQAQLLAERLQREGGNDEERVELAYELLFTRPPTPSEVAKALAFIGASGWTDFAHVLLCSNEFIYVP
jgi:hypothetical protein